MSFLIGGLTIKYVRGGEYSPDQKSPIFDDIVLTWNSRQQSPTNTEKLDIIAFLNQSLRSFEPGRIAGTTISKEDAQLLAIHQSTLERLERLNEDLVRQSAEFRERLEETFEEKIRKNDDDVLKKKDVLEAEHKSRVSSLEAREQALDEKLKIIDDRDNTHVRREIRDKMLDDVKDRIKQFGVSPATAQKRRPVFIGITLLVFTFFCLMGYTAYEIDLFSRSDFSALEAIRNIASSGLDKTKVMALVPNLMDKVSAPSADKTHIYLLWLRFTALSLGLLGTILYYIKWQNKWAEQHSNSEFQLQQFYIDVNRANWVIESCLEWRKETDSAIPKELLGSITNNLFVNNETEPERVIHPADELASALLGSASKLKLKVGDSELEFDKPQKISNKPLTPRAKAGGEA